MSRPSGCSEPPLPLRSCLAASLQKTRLRPRTALRRIKALEKILHRPDRVRCGRPGGPCWGLAIRSVAMAGVAVRNEGWPGIPAQGAPCSAPLRRLA